MPSSKSQAQLIIKKQLKEENVFPEVTGVEKVVPEVTT